MRLGTDRGLSQVPHHGPAATQEQRSADSIRRRTAPRLTGADRWSLRSSRRSLPSACCSACPAHQSAGRRRRRRVSQNCGRHRRTCRRRMSSTARGDGKTRPIPSDTYTFVRDKKPSSGSSPGLIVTDSRGRRWHVKQGREAGPEVVRVACPSAVGYHQPPRVISALVRRC